MKSNEEILANAIKNKEITYRDIMLLKRRITKTGKDASLYRLMDSVDWEIPMDSESGEKGLKWLKSLLTKNGNPRKGVGLGYREINIINSSKPTDFNFRGFYEDGPSGRNFAPIYEIGGMEYVPYAHGEKIYVIG